MTEKHLRFEAAPPTSEEDSLSMEMAREGIPHYMHEGLVNYILHGRSVGHFLTAVLTNNLKEAVSRADGVNAMALAGYVRFLYSRAPMICWGDEKIMKNWQNIGGLKGYLAQKEQP
jgi:hypothetical protein